MNREKLNILYIAHEGHMGGASKSLVALAKIMMSRGHKVTVLIPFRNSEMENKLKENGIKTIAVLYTWWQYPENEGKFIKYAYKLGYMINPIALEQIYRKLEKEKIDIIHSNSSVLDIGMKLSEKMNVPHVWHFREFGKEDLGIEYTKGKEKSMKIINQSHSRLIYISNAMQKYYSQWLKQDKGQVIYNGIGAEYLLEKNTCGRAQIRFLISGALQPGKGQECAIKAAAILKKQGITNFRICIAGRSIADYDKKLRKLCEKEAVTDIIDFAGFVSNMQELRKKSDIELVCSKREAFGRVTVEAMMSSNPVIASRSGANPELIQEGKTGFLYTLDSSEELADCMKKFLLNPELIYKMGKQAYCMAKDKFTAEKNAIQIETLYYDILMEKKE